MSQKVFHIVFMLFILVLYWNEYNEIYDFKIHYRTHSSGSYSCSDSLSPHKSAQRHVESTHRKHSFMMFRVT
jgi:hypothetical protein